MMGSTISIFFHDPIDDRICQIPDQLSLALF
jgi:hypothetical protein